MAVVEPGVPSPMSALDVLPDGVVIADADGIVTIANAASRRLLEYADGDPGRATTVARRSRSRTSTATTGSTASGRTTGFRSGHRLQETSWRTTSGAEVLVTGTLSRDRPGGKVVSTAWSLRDARARHRRRARAFRPGRDRRARAPLAADRGEGLHRHPAVEVGPLHRRAEAADAAHRRRRRRPAHPADRASCSTSPGSTPAGSRCARSRSTSSTRSASQLEPLNICQSSATSSSSLDGTARAGLGRPRQAGPGRRQPGRERRSSTATATSTVTVIETEDQRRRAARRRRGRGHRRGDPTADLHQVLEARPDRWVRPGALHRRRPDRAPTTGSVRVEDSPAGGARMRVVLPHGQPDVRRLTGRDDEPSRRTTATTSTVTWRSRTWARSTSSRRPSRCWPTTTPGPTARSTSW